MEDTFKPQNLTVSALFGNTDARYQIPQYQRPYKWGDEQVSKLWEDLIEAYENNETNYFLGSIITAKPEGEIHYLDIVDGQQRATTLMILFCVCRDLYPDLNQDDEDPARVDISTLNAAIRQNNRTDRLRLYTHSNHQSDFKSTILEDGATKKAIKPTKKQLSLDEEPRFKFHNTAFIFRENLKDMGPEKAGSFINFIFNNVQIIRIDCTSVGFAIKLFQVLNDRGLDLTNSDLIKSFLLDQVYRKNIDDASAKNNLEKQFMDDWKSCEAVANSTDYSMNDLFVLYQYYVKAQNPKKSLSDELQAIFKPLDPNEVIADFKTFCNHYKNEFFESKDKTISSLWYLPWNFYWRSILLTAKHTNYADFDKLAKSLHRYYYLHWIAGNTLTKIKQFSFNLIKSVKENKAIALIQKEMDDNLTESKVEERAIEELKAKNLYYQRWCKPLLFTIEYNINDSQSVDFLEIDDRNIQVEHILPRAYANMTEWAHIDAATYENWVDSGGNLTLLSGRKNIEASNSPFSTKISVYVGKGRYGNENKKITSFQITQMIVNDFNQNKYGKAWNLEAIEQRYDWFLRNVEEIFNLKIRMNE